MALILGHRKFLTKLGLLGSSLDEGLAQGLCTISNGAWIGMGQGTNDREGRCTHAGDCTNTLEIDATNCDNGNTAARAGFGQTLEPHGWIGVLFALGREHWAKAEIVGRVLGDRVVDLSLVVGRDPQRETPGAERGSSFATLFEGVAEALEILLAEVKAHNAGDAPLGELEIVVDDQGDTELDAALADGVDEGPIERAKLRSQLDHRRAPFDHRSERHDRVEVVALGQVEDRVETVGSQGGHAGHARLVQAWAWAW